MKSLQESLFDSDLVLQKLPYEKLLKGRISRDDILHFIAGCYEGDFINVKNRVFRKWCSDFWDREIGENGTWDADTLCPGYYTWVSKNDTSQESLDWIKPGKIHNDVTYNDAMYANALDVSWKWWGEKQQWKNITEWTIVTKNTNSGYFVYALANRKDYSETDQVVIHKIIKLISNEKSTRKPI